MAKNTPTPSTEYWAKIAELDALLFERGTRNARGLLGKIATVQEVAWSKDGKNHALVTARVEWAVGRDRWLSSHLCQYEGTLALLRSGAGSIAVSGCIAREVVYNPVDRGGYAFRDYGYFLPDDMGVEEQRYIVKESKRGQDHAGFSLPNDETYEFIMNALTAAENATQ